MMLDTVKLHIFYFGCLGQIGHHVWQNSSPPQRLGRNDPLHKIIEAMDGVLPPQWGKPVQGEVVHHDIFNFAVVAWWDNSVDSRPKSNSAFWVEGEHSAKEALCLGLERFPTVAARITYPFVFNDDESEGA